MLAWDLLADFGDCNLRSKVMNSTRPGLWKHWMFLLFVLLGLAQTGCGYVAAAGAGAVVGHEVAEEEHEDDDDDDDDKKK
jgi:hypothetical protein